MSSRPVLILSPTSVAGNWLREVEQFCPGLRSLLIHGPARHACFMQIPEVDIVVTTYPLLLRDHAHYEGQAFSLLALDEAQAIKNPAVEAQASDRAYRIGQDKPVFVYKLIAAVTVEERIQALQAQKRALADTLLSDTGSTGLPRDGKSLLALLEQ